MTWPLVAQLDNWIPAGIGCQRPGRVSVTPCCAAVPGRRNVVSHVTARTRRSTGAGFGRPISLRSAAPTPGPVSSNVLASPQLAASNAESVQQQSPGQAHASWASVSAALGTRPARSVGRAGGRVWRRRPVHRGRNEARDVSPRRRSRWPAASTCGVIPQRSLVLDVAPIGGKQH